MRRGIRTILLASLFFCTAACSRQIPPGPILIALVADARPAFVQVTGLSSRELDAMPAGADEAAWHSLLKVSVAGAAEPVVGRYTVKDGNLEFHPKFPFDPGRSYLVRFDSGRLPEPRSPAALETVVALPGQDPGPPTVISAIDPGAGAWPANLLRFYLHFSAPMSRDSGVGLVHLVDDTGEEVPEALLPATVDFWNDDHTRYTVFFDPGRVKRGILPNRRLGRALEAGRRYAIVVDAGWRDAHGRPLGKAFRHEFVAAPPIERALDTGTWRIQPPAADSRNPLVVTVPHGLDHALFQRAIGVADGARVAVAGDVTLASADTAWRFTPRDAWRPGKYELVILSILEDPAGNRINHAFEVEPDSEAAKRTEPDEYRVPFEISRLR